VLALGLVRLLTKEIVATLLAASLAAIVLVGSEFAELLACFLAGAVLSLWHVPLRGWAAAACVVPLAATLALGGFPFACATAGAYLVLYLGLGMRPVRRESRADLSYGVYVWAYPVQQTVTMTLGPSWWVNVALSAPVVLGLAWLSWHLVEEPALTLKDAFSPRRRLA